MNRISVSVAAVVAVLVAGALASGAMAKKPGVVFREGGHSLEGTGVALTEEAPIEVTMESSLGECSLVHGVMEMGVNGATTDTVLHDHGNSGTVWINEDASCELEEGGKHYEFGAGMTEMTLLHSGKVKFNGTMSVREFGAAGLLCAWNFKYLPGKFTVPEPDKAAFAIITAKAKGHGAKIKGCATKPESQVTFTLADNGGDPLETTLG